MTTWIFRIVPLLFAIGGVLTYRLAGPAMGVVPLAIGAADGTQIAVKTVMMVLVSLVVLAAAVRIVLKHDGYDEGTKKWASAAIGTIIGFWLKG